MIKVDICKSRSSEIFPRIRLVGCSDDFDFRKNHECQAWVKHLLSYIKSRVKPFVDARIYPYHHGTGTYLAVDIDPDNPNDEACVIVTIFLSGDRITLDTPTDGQLDIELPGIIDALWLASNISKTLGNPTETPSVKLWLGSGAVN